MKINEIIHESEDDAYTYKNPLPVLDYDNSAFIFDELDRIEVENYNKYREQHNLDDNLQLRLKLKNEYFNEIGKIQHVPINKIDTIEEYLDPVQLDKLVNGKKDTKSSSVNPMFLKYNGRYIAGDGTHRTVAAHLRGEKTIKGLVIDIKSINN